MGPLARELKILSFRQRAAASRNACDERRLIYLDIGLRCRDDGFALVRVVEVQGEGVLLVCMEWQRKRWDLKVHLVLDKAARLVCRD